MTATSPQGRTEMLRPDGSPVRVLVVDDEAALSELLSMALRYEGWQIRTAADGRGAVQAAREFRPDTVVLDMMLPDMDGLSVLGRLRRELPDVPVLFLTAKDAVEDRIAGLTAGGDDYVTKPFSLEEVVAARGEPGDTVLDGVLGGQEQHGHVGQFAAQPAEDGQAVHVGQHHVQDDGVGPELARGPQGALAVPRAADLPALVAQGHGEQFGDRLLVVHHKHADGAPVRPQQFGAPLGRDRGHAVHVVRRL